MSADKPGFDIGSRDQYERHKLFYYFELNKVIFAFPNNFYYDIVSI